MAVSSLAENWEVLVTVAVTLVALLLFDGRRAAKQSDKVKDVAEDALQEQRDALRTTREEKVAQYQARAEDAKNLPLDARKRLLLDRVRRRLRDRADRFGD